MVGHRRFDAPNNERSVWKKEGKNFGNDLGMDLYEYGGNTDHFLAS